MSHIFQNCWNCDYKYECKKDTKECELIEEVTYEEVDKKSV